MKCKNRRLVHAITLKRWLIHNATPVVMFYLVFCFLLSTANAHHVLGRPAYSLNEDSNTPPSMHVETQIGEYFVTYMVFPAFPRPNEPGRINLYAKRIDNGAPFEGRVTFSVQHDSWLGSKQEQLGIQTPDDTVFRQGFVFQEPGDYIITARFVSAGESHIIDFPLRIGEKSPIGPLGIAVGVILVVLIGVTLILRKRLQRTTIRNAHREET